MTRALVFALLAFPVHAFAASPVVTGERVRVTLIAREPAPVTGRVIELPPGAILLSTEPDSTRREIPRAAIADLEVRRGTSTNAGRGAVIGALIGRTEKHERWEKVAP